MSEAPVVAAFLEANVLYPALPRNILLRLASQQAFHARWSMQVHERHGLPASADALGAFVDAL